MKVGDRIDAVQTKNVMHYKISHWARGTIITVLEPDQFYVSFENETN